MIMNGIYTSESNVNMLNILSLYTMVNLFGDLYYLPKPQTVFASQTLILLMFTVINIQINKNIYNAIELYNKNNCLREIIKKSKERWLIYVLTVILIIKNMVSSFMEIPSIVRFIVLLCIQLANYYYLETIIKKAERKKKC
jgi:hypothetical protein